MLAIRCCARFGACSFGGGTGTCDGAVQREDSRAALVTWWLEPGQLALVIDHTSTTLGVLGGAVDYTVSLRAAVNPMRGGAGETWLDPYGLGLANETLDRIGAMSESSGSVVLSAFPWTIHGTSHTPPAALRHKWRGIAYAPNTGKLCEDHATFRPFLFTGILIFFHRHLLHQFLLLLAQPLRSSWSSCSAALGGFSSSPFWMQTQRIELNGLCVA